MVQRALISVYDKSHLREFAALLLEVNPSVEILSTGGTAKVLREWNFPVKDISQFTGFPEVFQGRVKTLHPLVSAGILYRRERDREEALENGILPIDLVVCNLYPFEEKCKEAGIRDEDLIEEIDIGGPTMIRAAAKNHADVAVVVSPNSYGEVMSELKANEGELSLETRKRLAALAFSRTAEYDAKISEELNRRWLGNDSVHLKFDRGSSLRYGENWHQKAMVYFGNNGFGGAEKLGGKEISFNNYLDFDAALSVILEEKEDPACVVIKHNNPCGFATGDTLVEALAMAFEGDPVSAFGGVLAFNRNVDTAVAKWLEKKFVEGILAPSYDADALESLLKKQNLILLALKVEGAQGSEEYRFIRGGILRQQRDDTLIEKFGCVTEGISFPEEKRGLALFANAAVKHIKSNAIALAREYREKKYQLMGIGAGQPNRVQSVELAINKTMENLQRELEGAKAEEGAKERLEREKIGDMIMASDAFFPFPDSIKIAGERGVRFCIQPGGSQRDAEVIEESRKQNIAMVFTGVRHFRH